MLFRSGHRTVAQQETLTLIRARDALVRLRTGAVNSVRGLAKPCGYRLPASSTLTFAKRCLAVLPPALAQALGPLLQQIADMTVKIKRYDREIQKLHPCGPVGLLARKLEGDNNNAIPGNRAAGGVGSGLKFCGHDGSLGGLVQTVSKTPGDTQNFDCTIWQYADVDGHHTLDVHLPGLFGVLGLRLGDDLGRLDFNGGSNENWRPLYSTTRLFGEWKREKPI